MKRFLRIYAEALAITLAIAVPIFGVLVPIVLFLVYDNPWWFLMYIAVVPFIAALVGWAGG